MAECKYRKGNICDYVGGNLYQQLCFELKCSYLKYCEKLFLKYSKQCPSENDIRFFLKQHHPIEMAKENIKQYRHFRDDIRVGKTTELLDKLCFDHERYQFLVIQNAFKVESYTGKQYSVSLCMRDNRQNFVLSNVTYTLSEIKAMDVMINDAPKLIPKPFMDLGTLVALALFGKDLSKIEPGEMIPLNKAIAISAQTTKEHAQVWKDSGSNSFRWNSRKFFVTHILIDRELSDKEIKKILKWNWRNEYIQKKQLLVKLKSRFQFVNQKIVHQVYGNGIIVDVDEIKDRIKVEFFDKEVTISLSQSLERNIIRFVSSKTYNEYVEFVSVDRQLADLRHRAELLNKAETLVDVRKLMPDDRTWEKMRQKYEKAFPPKTVITEGSYIDNIDESKIQSPQQHQPLQIAIEGSLSEELVKKFHRNRDGEKFTALIEKDFLRVYNQNYELYKQAVVSYQENYHRFANFDDMISNRDMDNSLKRVLHHLRINERDEKELFKRIGNHRSLGLEHYGKKVSEITFRRELEYTLGMLFTEIENSRSLKLKNCEDDLKTNKWQRMISSSLNKGMDKKLVEKYVQRRDYEGLKEAKRKHMEEIARRKEEKQLKKR